MSNASFTNATTVTSNQFIYPVFAHAPELHGRPAQPEVALPLEQIEAEDSELETDSPQAETNSVTETEAVETAAPVPSIAAMPTGLGESLFAILVALPWLLMALRIELNTQKNRT
ncbi:MAG: hypothetical protein AAFY17_15750 [Cyanobacteria bacterium J06642_11]